MSNAALPFGFGLVVGALVISVVGFANDWVVTAESKKNDVRDAWVNGQAAVCASLAEAHLKSTKNTVSLDGYQTAARQARDDLAREFAVALPGAKTAESIVVSACARMLNKPKA